MITDAQYIYGLCTGTYVVTNLVCAAVRWFHMCRPYDRHPDYCYPGRKATTLCFLVAVFNLPYIFLPGSNGTWLLTRAYFLPGELFILGILLFSYFGTVMHWRKWRGPTLTLALMALTALISGPIISLVGGDKVNTTLIANGIIYGLGAYMTAFCILALLVVRKWASKIDEEEYSNPADFPVTFARKALRMGTLVMMFVWINALLNCPAAMAVLCILLSILNVSLLISALHPHRDNVPDEEAEPERPAAGSVLPPAKAKALADAIRHVVEEEEAFLDSHLTLQEVACRCGTSRTYIANVFRTEFGGFFVYVNTLRLQYADHYAQAHPRAKIGEIIEASGFGSRSSYYAVKAKLRP